MKNLLILLLIIFACNSCQETQEDKFEKDGVSLTSPNGWKITDKENLSNQGYYLCIEKDGLNSSGLITLIWVNGEFELNEWINIHKEEMKNNIIYKNSNLVFGDIHENKFNNLNTSSLKFTFSLFGVKHQGVIHAFYKKEKTFYLLIQEAIEDQYKNRRGLELIEQSFKIE
ncbi:MAG: hypothetical protein JKY08_10795 [Flavobacteriaceae bacterium]|nr:hypothetical protein [Flavobacteriaceae bacterium]